MVFGFGLTIGLAKKKDPHYFAKVCIEVHCDTVRGQSVS